VPISGIQSLEFDLAFAYKFKVYFGLFPSRSGSTLPRVECSWSSLSRRVYDNLTSRQAAKPAGQTHAPACARDHHHATAASVHAQSSSSRHRCPYAGSKRNLPMTERLEVEDTYDIWACLVSESNKLFRL
jgi:hypothetical protein